MNIDMKAIGNGIVNGTKERIGRTVLDPINQLVDQQITDISTTIGSFIIRSIRGKFQRSISFTSGRNYSDSWMEEALYAILYQYNDIKGSSKLELKNPKGYADGSGLHYQLDDGAHNLKYRDFKILLAIQTISPSSMTGRITTHKVYTVITYDLRPEFVTLFERDMIANRNAILKIKSDSPTINVYKDYHESDGYTYWEKDGVINKRKLSTIYLPRETKKLIVDTVNSFFGSKKYYNEHGICHNLKIMLYGIHGGGKDSIARMIASEWNRNLYYVTGGRDGLFIPDAIMSKADCVNYPLFLISDIDKYPYLINEPDINHDDVDKKEKAIKQKQAFGSMINALDGILSGEDRIIIMTTNHIEKFNEVFLRPGRVDLKLEIKPVTAETFRQYVYDFYKIVLPEDIELNDDKLSIATFQFETVHLKMSADEFIEKHTKKKK